MTADISESEQNETMVDVTRRQLYELVWATPLHSLSVQYDISDVGLAKICRRADVPTPPRGYWAKREAGIPVTRPRLPTLRNADSDQVVATLTRRNTATEPALPALSAIQQQRTYEDQPEHRITVTAPLVAISRVHPLVRHTASALRKSKQLDRGLLWVPGEAVLDVRVSAEQLDRAMCIMDALIKALEARGLPVACRPPRPVRRSSGYSTAWAGSEGGRTTPVTCVQVDDQDVLISVREHRTRVDRKQLAAASSGRSAVVSDPYPRYDFVGSGMLVLSLPHHVGNWGAVATWAETPRRSLETMLNDIVVGIVAAAAEFREVLAYWANEERDRDARARQARLEQEQREREAARVQHLEIQASNWTMARRLREFITAVQGAGDQTPPGVIPTDMTREAWLEWAERHARTLDPLDASIESKATS